MEKTGVWNQALSRGVYKLDDDRSMEGRPLEDSELAERARRGDIAAYEELVRRYQDVAFRAAYLITGNAQEAEDAAQEAFIKAFYALDRFRQGAPFRPWLLRIVTNEARNRQRSVNRRTRLALQVAGVRPSDDAAPSPEAAALAREDQRELLDGLAELPDGRRARLQARHRQIAPVARSGPAARARYCRTGQPTRRGPLATRRPAWLIAPNTYPIPSWIARCGLWRAACFSPRRPIWRHPSARMLKGVQQYRPGRSARCAATPPSPRHWLC
jgi:RNA polymerase sigma-70 factor (ECF subfamily)